MLIAGLILWFVFVLGKIAILVVVAFAPLLIVGYLWAPTRAWVRRTTEVLIALVFTKTAIFTVFGIGLALLARGTQQPLNAVSRLQADRLTYFGHPHPDWSGSAPAVYLRAADPVSPVRVSTNVKAPVYFGCRGLSYRRAALPSSRWPGRHHPFSALGRAVWIG